MLVRGKALTTIGEQLNLSPKTVSTYKQRLMEKLQVDHVISHREPGVPELVGRLGDGDELVGGQERADDGEAHGVRLVGRWRACSMGRASVEGMRPCGGCGGN